MAATDRPPANPVAEPDFRADPTRFDFFHAVRRLECAHADRPRIGASRRVAQDPVRFGQRPSMAFAPATLTGVESDGEDGPLRIDVQFMGLFGPHGPLPAHLTDYALSRLQHHHDPTLRRFLDVFHHRMISLFYRAWATARPEVHHDRPGEDRFAEYLASLAGLAGRAGEQSTGRLFFAAHLAMQARHPDGLAETLAAVLGVDARIEEFVGRWLDVPEECRCQLGGASEDSRLGASVLGDRVWDCQHAFRIVLGPMSLGEYRRLLPGGDALGRMAAWVRQYAGQELQWDVKLILRGAEVPPTRLDGGSQLGWTSWLGRGGPDAASADRGDLVLRPRDFAKRTHDA